MYAHGTKLPPNLSFNVRYFRVIYAYGTLSYPELSFWSFPQRPVVLGYFQRRAARGALSGRDFFTYLVQPFPASLPSTSQRQYSRRPSLRDVLTKHRSCGHGRYTCLRYSVCLPVVAIYPKVPRGDKGPPQVLRGGVSPPIWRPTHPPVSQLIYHWQTQRAPIHFRFERVGRAALVPGTCPLNSAYI